MSADARAQQPPLPPCPEPPALFWSTYFANPPANGIVVIPAGVTVYLDVPTPDLNALLIEGNLVFDH